ncbi:uncharacterized protein LOC113343344 [Papaver somniferum]|uniref:uncharacterized protein LOC113343344 n=1 Tax=Papaver somniferum TaxID=3469 RepID=UPI000E704187|nr:uncharacterized protein LOC113343344 [Papaver somniferum]
MSRKKPANTTRQPRLNLHWIAPPNGTLTINSDGSFDNFNGGIGLIICDFAGRYKGPRCIYLAKASSPEHAKCNGLWEAVKWPKEMNLRKVHIELDSKLVVEAVNNDSYNIDGRLHNLIRDIRISFHEFSSWNCYYVQKEKNKIADVLSKLAIVDKLNKAGYNISSWSDKQSSGSCKEEHHCLKGVSSLC